MARNSKATPAKKSTAGGKTSRKAHPAALSAADRQWATKYIESQEWRYSTTMRQWPHWYIDRDKVSRRSEFERFERLIERHGIDDDWNGEIRRYLHLGRFKYWVHFSAINRAAPLSSAETRRRGKLWLRRNRKKVVAYGNLAHDETIPRVPKGEYANAADYVRAFEYVASEGIHENHKRLLQEHVAAVGHTLSWRELAKRVGYANESAVKLQYGRFARRIATELGILELPSGDFWLDVLAKADGRDDDGHLRFTLRKRVVQAASRVGLVRVGARRARKR